MTLEPTSGLPEHLPRPGLAVAVDVGTTTVAALLLDRSTGAVLARASSYNAQIAEGDNVATRIAACSAPGALAKLQSLLVEQTLAPLIAELLETAGCKSEDIAEIALSGNTTMTHLALGFSPVSIGVLPFEPLYRQFPELPASDLGSLAFPQAKVIAAPAISGFVGGDIVSDIAVTRLHEREGTTLLIDIGTNGEMVLAKNGKMLATATAAEPAFEGAGILCGMRAQPGAIEKIAIGADDSLTFSVIGNTAPKGLCGTAVIDLISEGFKRGWLLSSGRFDAEKLEALGRLTVSEFHGRTSKALVIFAEKAGASPVLLTEADIAEIIKAKAAIYAGAKTLLIRSGLRWQELDRIILAGGFAAHLDIASAIGIGLLPELPSERYEIAGNGSLAGACGLVLHPEFSSLLRTLHDRPEVINLAETDEFEDEFIDALALPHLDEDEFSFLA